MPYNRVLQNTPKFEIQGVHHFSAQEMNPIEAKKNSKLYLYPSYRTKTGKIGPKMAKKHLSGGGTSH